MRTMLVALCAVCAALLFNVDVAQASIAYGTLNNFDCVNDTGFEAHGFDIEIEDAHSTDITYTYDYNHYGVPKITEDHSNPAHPKVLVRYASAKNPNGTWAAYTAIPAGPIPPTQGHQFTDPSVNFGGEHFGVGIYGAPTAVRYFWLIDDGTGNLVRGAPVNVSTPTFVYSPPIAAAPANVVAVIAPPPPPAPPVFQFGDATWVKAIKTTTHNANKVRLVDLVPDDEGQLQPWANGEAPEVEFEWKILQTRFAAVNGGVNGELQGAPEDLPGGDEVITRRWEFYKYIGPIDAESGEAMATAVAADGIHGVGTVTYNDHVDPLTGEWVTVTVDLATVEVVGEFFGAQMSGFDIAPALGLIDHLQDGEVNLPYVARTVVVGGNSPYVATITSGALPNGMTLDGVTGILSGTPTVSGSFTFVVNGIDSTIPVPANVSQSYTLKIAGAVVPTSTITTSASPAVGGTTAGGGVYNNGDNVTVIATANAGYAFVNWTEGGAAVSALASYSFIAGGDRTLVANFVQAFTVATSASPTAGGITGGDGTYNSGTSVTVTASPNAGYAFVNWTEGGVAVSASASYTFNIGANRALVANFASNPPPTISRFYPSSGVPGTIVTITGTRLYLASSVTFGGVAGLVQSNTPTAIHVSVPVGAASGPIAVTTQGGTAISAASFTVNAPPVPTVRSFSPTSGAVNATVTISGSGLLGASSVTFGGATATIVSDTATTVKALVPAGAVSGPIAVTTLGGTATSVASFTVTASPVPADVHFSPASGVPGTTVSIHGTGLLGASSVTFGGVAATILSSSATLVKALVPAGAASGPIAVTTVGGTATSVASFTVNPSPVPVVSRFSPVSAVPGTTVTISGSGLLGASSVTFGGVAAAIVYDTATVLKALVPAGAVSGTIAVTTPGGTAVSAGTFTPK